MLFLPQETNMKNYSIAKQKLAEVELGRDAFYNSETECYCIFGALAKPDHKLYYDGRVTAFIQEEYGIHHHLANRIIELYDACPHHQLREWANRILDALNECTNTLAAGRAYHKEFTAVCDRHPKRTPYILRREFHEGLTNTLVDCIKSN